MKPFELIAHTADLKIRVYGNSLPELFAHAVVAMFQCIRPIVSACRYQKDLLVCDELPVTRHVKIISVDLESLLVDFLSEALYLSDVYDEAYLDATIEQIHEMNPTHGLKALVSGTPENDLSVEASRKLEFSHLSGYCKPEFSGNKITIQATLHGIKIEGFEVVEIKAVTHHELQIKRQPNGWQADIVFDI